MNTSITDDHQTILDHLKFVFLMDQLASYISVIVCGPGILFNGLLIYLILKKTPNTMKSYAVFLLNFAVFDFATCILSLFSCQKVVFSGFSLIYVFHGPCKKISAWFCYFCHCFECHTLAHSQWILLGSFIYRYRVLIGDNPTVKQMYLWSLALYSMSFLFLVVYVNNDTSPTVLLYIIDILHPEYHYKDKSIWKDLTIGGNLSMFSPITFVSIMYMTFPCVPIYIAILVFRKRTMTVLHNPDINLSPQAKASHRKLVRALTVQASIPIFWLVASFIYTSAQFGFIKGPIPENITFRLMDCLPTISPIVTIIFINTYRNGLTSLFNSKMFTLFTPNTIGTSVVDPTNIGSLATGEKCVLPPNTQL